MEQTNEEKENAHVDSVVQKHLVVLAAGEEELAVVGEAQRVDRVGVLVEPLGNLEPGDSRVAQLERADRGGPGRVARRRRSRGGGGPAVMLPRRGARCGRRTLERHADI